MRHNQTTTTEWDYDELDDIYFKKSDQELECLRGVQRGSPRKQSNGLGPLGDRAYKGDQGKFLKSLQECLNWEKPQNSIADQYEVLTTIGVQPDVIKLNQLETVDEHVEWRMERITVRKELERKEQKKRQEEEERIQALRKKEQAERAERQKAYLERKALERVQQAAESPHKHRRQVTFDLASSTRSKVEMNQSQQASAWKTEPWVKDIDAASSGMSERTETTAVTSNYRYLHTPSPTKLRRDKLQLSQAGDNIMGTTLKLQNLNRDSSKAMSTCNTPSGSAMESQRFMPGQSLFDFAHTKPPGVSSSRASRAHNTQMTKHQAQHPSSPTLRMSRLMRAEYETVENNMIKKF